MSTLRTQKVTPLDGETNLILGDSGDTVTIPAGTTIVNSGTATGFGGDANITRSASDPTENENPAGGLGTIWLNTTSGEMFCLTDATTDTNYWKNIGAGDGDVVPTQATGGTLNSYTLAGILYQSHTFLASGTFTALSIANPVDIMICAGGGAGANWHGGGGGAGGMKVLTGVTVSAGDYNIVVGAGGAGGTTAVGSNGSDSSAISNSCLGGGRGGHYHTTAATSGGSGAGGNSTNTAPWLTGAAGTAGQGNAGGNGIGNHAGGGGGGKGSVGETATNVAFGGDGGQGLDNLYRPGVNVMYSGGGGGGTWEGQQSQHGGSGAGGGGNGSYNFNVTAAGPTAGAVNTGGGGGGSGAQGNNTSYAAETTGGSGIVVIRYAVQA